MALGDIRDRCRSPTLGNITFPSPLASALPIHSSWSSPDQGQKVSLPVLIFRFLCLGVLSLTLSPLLVSKFLSLRGTQESQLPLSGGSGWQSSMWETEPLSPADRHTGMKGDQWAPCSMPKRKVWKSPGTLHICTYVYTHTCLYVMYVVHVTF